MDLTEIELLDDNVTIPRQPSKEILKLRDEMIQNKEGKMPNLPIKFHYDDMVRIYHSILFFCERKKNRILNKI